VSASVAKKEHDEFASNIDMIDALPPGLYEAVMTPKNPNDTTAEFVSGDYLVRFEARTLDDIRALGTNNEEVDREFAAVAQVSEINLGLYRTFIQPWIRMWANEGVAEWMRRFHPLRMQYEIFSQANPFMRPLLSNLEWARENRQPVSKDNTFWQAQEWFGHWIETSLDAYRDVRDNTSEALFHAIYGSPLLQALVGLKASDENPRHRPGQDAAHMALVAQRIKELKDHIPDGGPREAVIRALLYIRMPDGVADERGFNLLRRMREENKGIPLMAFKQLLREQFFMLLLDERRAVEAIPAMLDRDPELASRMKGNVGRMIELVGVQSRTSKARLAEIEALFESVGQNGHLLSAEQDQLDLGPVRPMPAPTSRSTKHH
jgi:Protein of unknown function (DUF3141)